MIKIPTADTDVRTTHLVKDSPSGEAAFCKNLVTFGANCLLFMDTLAGSLIKYTCDCGYVGTI